MYLKGISRLLSFYFFSTSPPAETFVVVSTISIGEHSKGSSTARCAAHCATAFCSALNPLGTYRLPTTSKACLQSPPEHMQAIVNEYWRKTQIIKFAESCGQVSFSIAKWRLLFFWMTNFAKKVSTGGQLVHLPKILLFMV